MNDTEIRQSDNIVEEGKKSKLQIGLQNQKGTLKAALLTGGLALMFSTAIALTMRLSRDSDGLTLRDAIEEGIGNGNPLPARVVYENYKDFDEYYDPSSMSDGVVYVEASNVQRERTAMNGVIYRDGQEIPMLEAEVDFIPATVTIDARCTLDTEDFDSAALEALMLERGIADRVIEVEASQHTYTSDDAGTITFAESYRVTTALGELQLSRQDYTIGAIGPRTTYIANYDNFETNVVTILEQSFADSLFGVFSQQSVCGLD